MAGRKGFYEEQEVKKIVAKSNKIILWALEGKGKYKDLPATVLVELASRFSLKAMPQKFEGEGMAPQIITIVRSDESPVKAVSGRVHIHRSPISSNGVSLGDGKEPLPDSSGS